MKRQIDRLFKARERHLENRPVASLVASLGKLSLRWLDRNYSFRKKAVRRLAAGSGFTESMADELLDALFRELTPAKLLRLLKAELKDPRVLDEFRRDPLTGQRQRARGPRVITHIFSGNVPNPAIISFILGMLVKSANIGKVSTKDEGFLDIYLESLKSVDRSLAATNHVLTGPAGRSSLRECIEQSDLVVAYGHDESLAEIRALVPFGVPFVGYGHRVSFSVYAKEALNKKNLNAAANRTAYDIWMMDRRGCLSPAKIFIEAGGQVSLAEFSGALQRSMEQRYGIKLWRIPAQGGAVHALGSAGKKMIEIQPINDLKNISKALKPFQKYLQTISLEATPARRQRMAERLSELGVNRICRAGQMQRPLITWHHDGRPNLASWVYWTDMVE